MQVACVFKDTETTRASVEFNFTKSWAYQQSVCIICACVCVCVYVPVCVCACPCVLLCIHSHMNTHTTHTHAHPCIYICIHMRTYTMYTRQHNNTQGVHTLYAFEILRNDSVVGKKENEVKRWVIKKRFSHFKVFDKILQQVQKIAFGKLGARIRCSNVCLCLCVCCKHWLFC
jgi:hypothetical protein